MQSLTIRLERVSPVPLYHQIARQLEAAIEGGSLTKGTFLGNEIDLAERWQVSRPTVRRAIAELVEHGLLVRRRGVGTQVVNDQICRPVRLTSLYDDLAEQGRSPKTAVLRFESVRAVADVATALDIRRGIRVTYVERCRSAGSLRLAILRNWLLSDVTTELSAERLEGESLYALLRERGVRPHFATQTIGAAAATTVDAEILGVAVGAPLVTMRRVMQDDTGRRVEVGEHRYDAEHYSVETTVIEG